VIRKQDQPDNQIWRKSSFSNTGGSQCVEVAQQPHLVGVRDSKKPDDAQLGFTASAWRTFMVTLKH
jgi:hypothetical protein